MEVVVLEVEEVQVAEEGLREEFLHLEAVEVLAPGTIGFLRLILALRLGSFLCVLK